MKKTIYVIFITIFLITFTDKTYAFRCDQEIIGRLDSSESVINKCGNPSEKKYNTVNVNGQNQYVEEWYYNCGEQDFVYKITILNSKIIKETPIKRGHGKSECSKY